jgi:hypothetical protein
VVEHRSPLEFPSFEGVNDENPYEFVRVLLNPLLFISNEFLVLTVACICTSRSCPCTSHRR